MAIGQGLTLLAVMLQAISGVLYATFLTGASTPLFILASLGLTATVLLIAVRGRIPQQGRQLLVLANIWTAVGYIGAFFAMRHIPPALLGAIEIGISLITGVVVSAVLARAWPRIVRALVCVGIAAGCVFLSWREVTRAIPVTDDRLVWTAILVSVAVGITSALSAMTSRRLGTMGWTPATALAHRFYLTLGITIVRLPMELMVTEAQPAYALVLMGLIGTAGTLLPMLLLQTALRRTDEVSVLVCKATLPVISFLLSILLPPNEWDWLTLFGILLMALVIGCDVLVQRTGERAIIAREEAKVVA